MKTIALYHNKGGVGKTTVSVNLAAALKNKGKRVLLIDIDAQANSTYATGLAKFLLDEDDDLRDQNVFHLLESSEFTFIPDVARKSRSFNNPEIDVVPSHISLIEKQAALTRFAASRVRLNNKLKQVEDHYDIVIIDAPPSRDLYAEISLVATDYLIIPSDLKPFANQGLSNVKSLMSEVDELRSTIGKKPLQLLGVLASKILTSTKYLEFTFPKQRSAVVDRYQLPLMKSIIYERTALANCVNNTVSVGGLEYPDPKSIFEYDANSDSTKEFRNLAAEVLSKIGED